VAKPSRSAHFVSIALRVNNMLRLGFATAALHRHPAKNVAVSGVRPNPSRLIFFRVVRVVRSYSPCFILWHSLMTII
jgi:hypothetical protein